MKINTNSGFIEFASTLIICMSVILHWAKYMRHTVDKIDILEENRH